LSVVSRIPSSAAALVAIVGLAACGGGAQDRVAIRVGDSTITKATVDHWMSVMAPEHLVPDPPHYTACVAHQAAFSPESIAAGLEQDCRQQYKALKQRALALLISSQWLIDEATARGLKASVREVDKQPAAHVASSGASDTDGKLTTGAQLAAAGIRRALTESEAKVSPAEVVAYYGRNIQQFERPERRFLELFQPLPSAAAARKAMREVARGGSRSKLAFRESLYRSNIADLVPWKRGIERAIFAAKPNVLVGPLRLRSAWGFFEVTRVISRVVKPLARVKGTIERQLAGERQRRTLARFISAWRTKWIARTDCSPGYVVQKCRQYRGTKAPEDPLVFN
jgi:hypothetical protein